MIATAQAPELPFAGRAVLVTGGAGQIGRACVAAFAAAGAAVAVVDVAEQDLDGVVSIRADLSRPAELEDAFAAAERAIGPLDVLVQSAAVVGRRPFLEVTAEDIDAVFAVNVRALLLGARCAARSMSGRPGGGVIVNLTSTAGVIATGESVAYEASKGAVTMATRSLAIALAPAGIRVVAVGPGAMEKPQEMAARDLDDLSEAERRRIPMGRAGAPGEIAQTVLFVASPAASYITGTVIYADGGVLASW